MARAVGSSAGDRLQRRPWPRSSRSFPSYRAAWAHWHPFCVRYGSYALRSLHAWHQIRSWLAINAPEVAASLRPGASEADLDDAERQLRVRLPPALRALYRVHDGQDLEFDRAMDASRASMVPSVFHGLFGGYQFYSHVVSTRMLPLRRMVRWTQHVRQRLDLPPDDSAVLFAAGFNFNKLVQCVTDTGECLVSHVPALGDNAPEPAGAAPAVARAAAAGLPPAPSGPSDATLRWFELYSEALAAGSFNVEPIHSELSVSRGICLFQRGPPVGASAVTQGIEVSAAPLFVPELSHLAADIDEADIQYFFAYSIRFRLLSVEEQAAETPLRAAQLLDRAWTIRGAGGAVESEVRGEGVIGEYPLLQAGGSTFTYQSCSHQREPAGSMEGEFTFVEGSLQTPGARQIKARCPTFRLDVPSVVF